MFFLTVEQNWDLSAFRGFPRTQKDNGEVLEAPCTAELTLPCSWFPQAALVRSPAAVTVLSSLWLWHWSDGHFLLVVLRIKHIKLFIH